MLAVVAACGSATPAVQARPPVSVSPSPSPSPTSSPTPSSTPSPTHAPTRSTPSASPSSTPRPPIPIAIHLRDCPFPALRPITSAPGAGKTVALTFDDGSGPFTPQILVVLQRFGVHATFFDTGLGDTRYPQYARAVLAAGDQIGNHTYDHPENWGFRSDFTYAEQRSELTRTDAVLAPLIGHEPCVMRPPGGAYDSASLALVRSLGMSLVLWTTDAEDWQQPPYLSRAAQLTIIRNAEEGVDLRHPIILMHAAKASHEPDCAPTGCLRGQVSSFRGNTVAALPAIIKFYLAHGYRFVTLPS